MTQRLEEFLNSSESRALQNEGWELWQSHVVTSPQRTGFMLLFRRSVED